MSTDIEQRVVQMKFDNEGFEKGANQTIKTLNNLDQALSFKNVDKGITNFQNAAKSIGNSMKGTITTIEQTAKKYSWFEQIAIGAYRKVGEAATSYLSRQVLELTGLSRATEGWRKYEQEIEATQRIMNAANKKMAEVEPILEDISIFSDETSYSYESMVDAMGKFNAAGIKDLELTKNAMFGIANMAGYFGVNAADATHAMEGFAKAMGKGKMDSLSWHWIETAHMNTMGIQQAFIDAAVAAGTLKKTGEDMYEVLGKKNSEFSSAQFKESLKYGWLNQDAMMKTFGKYSVAMDDLIAKFKEMNGEMSMKEIIDEFGDSFDQFSVKAFEAGQQTRTFTDLLGALSTNAASAWRKTFRYIFGNYEESKELWGNVSELIWDAFSKQGTERNGILKLWYEGLGGETESGRTMLFEALTNIWQGFQNILAPIRDAWDAVFPSDAESKAASLIAITEKFRDITANFRSWFAPIGDVMERVTGNVDKAKESIEEFVGPVARTEAVLDQLVDEVWAGKWGTYWDRWNALEAAGYSWQLVQNAVNASVGNMKRYEVIADEVVATQQNLTAAVEDSNEAIYDFGSDESAARADRLFRIFRGLFEGFKMMKTLASVAGRSIGYIFSRVGSALAPLGDIVLEVFAVGGDKIHEFYENLGDGASVFDKIRTHVDVFSKRLRKGLDKVIDKGRKLKEMFGPMLSGLAKNVVPAIINGFDTVKKYFNQFYNWISPKVVKGVDFISEFFTKLWKKISNGEGFGKLKKTLTDLWATFSDGVGSLFGFTVENGGKLGENIKSFFGSLLGFEDTTNVSWADLLVTAIDNVAGSLSNLINWLSPAIGRIKDFFGLFKKEDTEDVERFAGTVERSMGSVERSTENVLNLTKNSKFEKLVQLFNDTLTFVQDAFTKLTNPLKAIKDLLTEFGEGLLKVFDEGNYDKLMNSLKNGGIGMFFAVLAKKIAEGAISITTIPQTFNTILMAIQGTLLSYQKKLNADALMTIAKAIGLLTLSIIGLGMAPIDNTELIDRVTSLSLLLLVLSAFVSAWAKLRTALNEKEKLKAPVEVAEKIKEQVEKTGSTFRETIKTFTSSILKPWKDFQVALNKSIDKKLNGSYFAKNFLLIAAAVALIATVAYQLYKSKMFENWQENDTLKTIGYVMAFTVAFMALANFVANFGKNKQTIGGALSFLTMAAAVAILADIALYLASLPPNMFSAAIGALTMLTMFILALGGALHIAQSAYDVAFRKSEIGDKKYTKSSGTKSHALALIGVMLGLAVSLTLMLPALKILSKMNDDELRHLGGVFIILGVAVVGLAYLLKMLGKLEGLKQGVKALAGVVAIMGIMTALIYLTGKIVKASGIGGIATFGAGLLAFAAALAAIAGAAWLFQKFGVNKIIAEFSKSINGLGFGLIMAAAALWIFAKALPAVIEGITALGNALANEETRKGFIIGVVAIIGAILAAILLMKTSIVSTLFNVVKGAFDTLKGKGGAFVTTFTGFLKGVADKVKKKWWLWAPMIMTLLTSAIGLLNAIIPGLGDKVTDALVVLILSIAAAVNSHGGELAGALIDLGISLMNVLGYGIAIGLDGIGALFDAIFDKIGFKKNDENKQSWYERWDDIVKSDAEKVNQKIREKQKKDQEEAQQASPPPPTAQRRRKSKQSETGASIIKDIRAGMEEEANNPTTSFDISSLYDEIPDEAKEYLKEYLPEGATDVMTTLGSYVDTNVTPKVEEKTATVVSRGVAVAKEKNDEIVQDTKETWDNVGFTLAAQEEPLREKSTLLGEAIVGGLRKAEETELIGENAVKGLIAGMTRKDVISKLSSTAVYVSNVMLRGMKSKQGLYEQSPSHKTFKFGEFAVLGLVDGALALIPKVLSTGQMVGNTMSSAISDAMAFASNAFSQDLDYSPMITPLVNLNDVKNSVSALDSLFSPRALAIADEAVTKQLRNRQYNFEQQQYATEALNSALAKLDDSMQVEAERSYDFNIPVVINGREVAKASATYTRAELNRIDKLEGRKGGKV